MQMLSDQSDQSLNSSTPDEAVLTPNTTTEKETIVAVEAQADCTQQVPGKHTVLSISWTLTNGKSR